MKCVKIQTIKDVKVVRVKDEKAAEMVAASNGKTVITYCDRTQWRAGGRK